MLQTKITQSLPTNREGIITYYFDEIKDSTISVEEEVSLALKARTGKTEEIKKKAKDELVKANLLFIVSVSKQYQNQGLELLDLNTEGVKGAMKAADRYDETRGFKFISYAVWYIRQAIISAIDEHSRTVRLPQNVTSINKSVNKVFSKLENKLGRDPSPKEIADNLEITEDKVVQSLKSSQKVVSFDSPIGDGLDTFIDVFTFHQPPPCEDIDKDVCQKQIAKVINTLNANESFVIFHTYGLCGYSVLSTRSMSLDLSDLLNLKISESDIEKLKKKGISHLRCDRIRKILREHWYN